MEVLSNCSHLRSSSLHTNSNGAIDACKQCSGSLCCGIVSEGGIIEPPYLTRHDIREIEYLTGLSRDRFTSERRNPETGNTIFVMQTTDNEGCLFFDRDKGKCQIHSFRPMDCRLFPLDCDENESEYFLTVYKYKKCSISNEDLLSLLTYSEEALQILGDELHDYATYPVPGMQNIGYEVLMKVKTKEC